MAHSLSGYLAKLNELPSADFPQRSTDACSITTDIGNCCLGNVSETELGKIFIFS